MKSTVSNEFEAGRLTPSFATADPATVLPGDIGLAHGAARAGDLRQSIKQGVNAVLTRIERAIDRILHRLRDARDRHATLRELRRLSPTLLADIGIEPEWIERVVDAAHAPRRQPYAMWSPGSLSPRR